MLNNLRDVFFKTQKPKPVPNKADKMIIPIISLMLPALIQSAEHMFSGDKKGPDKKAFVMQAVSSMLDKMSLPSYIDKKLILELIGVLVDYYVPAVLKP
jgi:hypothetical protein